MSDDATKLEKKVRLLEKKLARSEIKIQQLETFHEGRNALVKTLMAELDQERAESERLLLNILPEPIAKQLREQPGVIADRFEEASVLFADMVGFTHLSEELSAEEMVTWLNGLYSSFDALVQQHGVEKIRTIGDNYMVAAGVPFERDDHAVILAQLALDMRDAVASLEPIQGHRVGFRIGINSGPVVGGVIGTHKFQYDIWGDTVNTAARMESHGKNGHIHVTEATFKRISDRMVCESRGNIDIKGKGEMPTWFVVGPR